MGEEGLISAAEPEPEAQDLASEQHCSVEEVTMDFRQMQHMVSLVVVSVQGQSAGNTPPSTPRSSSRSSMD